MKLDRCLIACTLLIGLTSGCSMDVIPVHYSRVNAAREAEKPVARGPDAPGAFRVRMGFKTAQGYVYDPTKIEIRDEIARLKEMTDSGGKKRFAGDADRAIIEFTSGIPYAALDGFKEVTVSPHQGVIRYQFSNNASAWFYHDGSKWIPAGPTHGNTAADANHRITTFHSDVGIGDLYVKAILVSPTGKEAVALKEIAVEGVAPKLDGWN